MNPLTRNFLISGLTMFILLTTLSAQQNSTSTKAIGTLSLISPERKIKEEDLKTKEISREIVMPKNGQIYIENSARNIVVKTWDQQKVKISTMVYYADGGKITDEEWLENTNISLKVLGSAVKIKLLQIGIQVYSLFGSTTAVVNNNGQKIGTIKNVVTVFIPSGNSLTIESMYADVTLPANLGDVNVDIKNGNLDAENLGNLILRSNYVNVNMGDVKNAGIELTNSRFSAKNIDELDIDTKNSTIELGNTRKAVVRSTNDQIEFEEVGEIAGRKNYGNLRITKLNKSIELVGSNGDIKIRNVSASVNLIKIDDKYADIRIPLKNTKNYSVDFTGAYSAVYGNFEKKALPGIDNEVQPQITVVGKRVPPYNVEAQPTITSIGTAGYLSVTGYLIDDTKLNTTSSGTVTTMSVTGKLLTPANNLETKQTTISAGTLNNLNTTNLSVNDSKPTIDGVEVYKGVLSASTISGRTLPLHGRGSAFDIYNDTPSKFTATVGDGKGLKIELKCQNCTVDFK